MRIDTGFRPSRHGFAFANTWHDLLFGVITSRGRCGGMVFAALDAFLAGRELPVEATRGELPAHDSPMAHLMWRRQVDSVVIHLGSNLWRFATLTYLPGPAPGGIAAATRRALLPLFDSLVAGRPVPLGLVSGLGLQHLARNHQVLAWGADFGEERVRISVYDPNYPLRDDIVLDVPFDHGFPVTEHVGGRTKPWRGLFVTRYRFRAVALTGA